MPSRCCGEKGVRDDVIPFLAMASRVCLTCVVFTPLRISQQQHFARVVCSIKQHHHHKHA